MPLLGALALSSSLAAGPPPAQSDPGTASVLGAPLVVDGERIPDDELKRFLCFGVGSKQTDEALLDRLLDEERVTWRAEGGYEVTLDEVHAQFEHEIADFEKRYPTLTVETEIERLFLSERLYLDRLDRAMQFGELFLFEPSKWSEWRSLVAIDYAAPWTEDARLRHLRTARPFVLETDRDRLPPGVLLSVNGSEVPIDEVFGRIRRVLRPEHVDAAKRWIAVTHLIENHLANAELPESDGGGTALLSRAEHRRITAAGGRNWNEVLRRRRRPGLQILGFPSLHAYGEYLRLRNSFARTIWPARSIDEFTRDDQWFVRPARFTCDVILVSAFDFTRNEWKRDGWESAERRAREIEDLLDHGEEWATLFARESEFWDPPATDVEIWSRPFTYKQGGRFVYKSRDQIARSIGEGEFQELLFGELVTDRMLSEENGTIAGPFEGPHGFYLSRVIGRVPAGPMLRGADELFLRTAFRAKVRELFEAAVREGRIQGL